MRRRGAWQRTVFAQYYRRFAALQPPPSVLQGHSSDGIAVGHYIGSRVPYDQYKATGCYDLTHDIFAAYDYGDNRDGGRRFDREELSYLRQVHSTRIYRKSATR
jgi:hypothetical protein